MPPSAAQGGLICTQALYDSFPKVHQQGAATKLDPRPAVEWII